ncbi:cyanophycinase [Thermoleptolyngbya sichuanensis A183]|uniref:Cyanophycinase n=1 Tax=Thermoleptolyngbya sichuanensis A183 TaxID=2737172 RepID=A0A6M8B409_9CYAN|nr:MULTISPECIES: cyanophycinase [Thermoleptolyngbya]QKD81108.1 cyanophycinase [Thermoleptolyngbya sichuanensis A183]
METQVEGSTAAADLEERVADPENVALPETYGRLIIIGGAEDKEGECKILREFVREAGGLQARVVVMTVATGLPGEVGAMYMDIFERLGVEDVRVVDTGRREDASNPKAIADIQQATGVFFTGGNQARITECLKDTELDVALHQRFAEGVVIAGTSAGAAMMPDMMIVEGESESNPRPESAKMDRGMGFFPGVVIDQHFAQRGRIGRLLSAVAQQPAILGFGIDENTAIVINAHEVEVIGEGSVTIVDVSELTHNNVDDLLMDEPLALCGAKLHILPHGYRFNLDTRSCIC